MSDSENNIVHGTTGNLTFTSITSTWSVAPAEIIDALNSASEKANINKYELEKAVQSIDPSLIHYAKLITKQKILNVSVLILALALNKCSIKVNLDVDVNELISQISTVSRDDRYKNISSNQKPESTKATGNSSS